MEYCIICGKPIINRRVSAKACSNLCSKKLHDLNMHKYYKNHKEDFKKYRQLHKEYFKKYSESYINPNPNYNKEYRLKNKDRINARNREHYQKNKPEKFCIVCRQKIILRQGKTCSENCYKIHQRELRKNKPKNFITQICIICKKEFNKESFGKPLQSLGNIKTCSKECSEKQKFYIRSRGRKRRKNRDKTFILQHYSGENPKCVCCGKSDFDFLTIDEINGIKHRHRRFYKWIIKHNYPENFQVLCLACNWLKGNNDKPYCLAHHPELYSEIDLPYQKEKDIVLEHYSTPIVRCVCCGETNKRILTIDHIHGDGKRHLKEIKSQTIYHWLIKNNFPQGFQVLCMNCNFLKSSLDKPFCKVHHPELYK